MRPKTPWQLLKSELKKVFPSVRFSVKYKSYAGWDSIKVERIDGPSENSVNEIAWKYQMGSFNWMEEMYEYNDNANCDTQAKYVFLERELTDKSVCYIEFNNLDKWEAKRLNTHRLIKYKQEVDL